MKNSRLATGFIATVAISGLAMLIAGALKVTALHQDQFLCLLVLGAVTSRTKVKLPGIDGTMSANLPFLLIAAAQLSLFEAAAVALVSAIVQSFPKKDGKFEPVKMLFNASTIVLAAGAAGLITHSDKLVRMPGSLALAAAGLTFLTVNTLPVATIIALTEGASMPRIWSSILHLSLPYYVACTGLTSMVTVASQHVGWQMPLAVLPVMFFMYRSYQGYFEQKTADVRPMARAAAAQ